MGTEDESKGDGDGESGESDVDKGDAVVGVVVGVLD